MQISRTRAALRAVAAIVVLAAMGAVAWRAPALLPVLALYGGALVILVVAFRVLGGLWRLVFRRRAEADEAPAAPKVEPWTRPEEPKGTVSDLRATRQVQVGRSEPTYSARFAPVEEDAAWDLGADEAGSGEASPRSSASMPAGRPVVAGQLARRRAALKQGSAHPARTGSDAG